MIFPFAKRIELMSDRMLHPPLPLIWCTKSRRDLVTDATYCDLIIKVLRRMRLIPF